MSAIRPPRRPLPVIGWREWVSLPDLGIAWIHAKVDTGARSSAIHAFDVEPFDAPDGRRLVRFKVHPIQRTTRETVEVVAEVKDERWVKSTSGHRDCRIVVEAHVALGGDQWPIELTLARRDVMGFRMLLGRQAIRGRFFVNPGRSHRSGLPEGQRRASKRPRPTP